MSDDNDDDRETFDFHGLKIQICSDAEAEAVSFVVCGTISHFADDVRTVCRDCSTPIVHRPYAPKTPPKICLACVTLRSNPQ